MNFSKFAKSVNSNFVKMCQDPLFILDVDKDELWQAYLNSFPAGTNDIYISCPFHDCSCCRYFIKNIGPVVSLKNGRYNFVWSVTLSDFYQGVADSLIDFLSDKPIKNIFLVGEPKYGTQSNNALIEGKAVRFEHFWCDVPKQYVSKDAGPKFSQAESSYQVLNRGLNELTNEAFETTLELIDQNSLYRGTEFRKAVQEFRDMKRQFESADNKGVFVWSNINSPSARIRNTAIGTLLQDLSEGIKDLDACLRSYESVMAPANYKRPTAVVTKGMIDKALKTIQEMDIEESLYRRHATIEDISANDVLFVDRAVSKKLKGVAAILKTDETINPQKLSSCRKLNEHRRSKRLLISLPARKIRALRVCQLTI